MVKSKEVPMIYFDSIVDKIKAKDVLVFARKFFNSAQCIDLVIKSNMIVFQKVCKFQFIYFCNRTVKNNLLWNLHLSK